MYTVQVGISSAIVLFKHQRNCFLLNACSYLESIVNVKRWNSF